MHRVAQRLRDAGTQPIVLEGGLATKTRDRLLATYRTLGFSELPTDPLT